MRVIVTELLLIFLLAQSCNDRRSGKSLYKQDSYIRISSEADSVQNLYVIYKSIYDTSRTMLKSYWDNGKVQSVGFFLKGDRDGPWMQFFDDGHKSFDGYFKQGLKQGAHTVYFPNGKVLSLEEYNNGNKTGHWYYYNTDGSLLRQEDHTKKEYAYIVGVILSGDTVFIDADYIQYLRGQQAVNAAKKEGALDTFKTEDGQIHIDVPNDYFIVNKSNKIRRLRLSQKVAFDLLIELDRVDSSLSIKYNSLESFRKIYKESPFILTIQNNEIVKIKQLFLP